MMKQTNQGTKYILCLFTMGIKAILLRNDIALFLWYDYKWKQSALHKLVVAVSTRYHKLVNTTNSFVSVGQWFF